MKKGFTLIELIIVIVIIGILALIALPRYFSNIENARRAEALTTLRSLRDADMAKWAKDSSFFPAATIPAAATPWNVDINNDGNDDISVAPAGTDFTYRAVPGAAAANECIQATPVAGAGPNTYGMCVQSGRVSPPAGATCAVLACP